MNNITFIRRGHQTCFRLTDLTKEQRSSVKTGQKIQIEQATLWLHVTERNGARNYYPRVRLASGYRWSDSNSHYPIPTKIA